MPFCCSSHCSVNSKQEKEAWHYTSLFNASGDLKPSCLFSLFQYRTLKIVIHDLHHSYQLIGDAIGLHDSPQSFAMYRVKTFFEVDKVCIECCLTLIDLFYDVTEDEYLIYCALVLGTTSLIAWMWSMETNSCWREETGKISIHMPETQCFRQTVLLRESRVAFREGPQKNGERANLTLYFHKAACRFNPITQYSNSHPKAQNCNRCGHQWTNNLQCN